MQEFCDGACLRPGAAAIGPVGLRRVQGFLPILRDKTGARGNLMALDISEARPVHRPVVVPWLPLLLAVYALAALLVAPATFWHLLTSYFFQMILLAEILLVAIPIAGIVLRPRAPVTMMRDILRYDSKRLLFTVLGFCFGMAAFTTFKISIPQLVPFYGDSLFADIDHWLHGGDPGLFLHRIIPDWAAGGIFFFYNVVWFFAWFGLMWSSRGM